MIYKPWDYQRHATEHMLQHPAAGLLLDMGLGKTVCTLTGIEELMYNELSVNKVLVIAPKRVADSVWTTEAHKWNHLKHLRISKILGDRKQRMKALNTAADVYVINRENVVWLITHLAGKHFPFDMIVIDELSSFKSPDSQRFKALRRIRPLVKRIVGLTGTPAPNSLIDLWSEMYLLDQGERLGKTLTSYREKYFTAGQRIGDVVFNYNLRKDETEKQTGRNRYKDEIYNKISDICISMQAKDYLQIPERIDNICYVDLPPQIMNQYDEFVKSQILALVGDKPISAVNAAALSGKLIQFANGAIYRDDASYIVIHNEKLYEIEEHIEAANGKPVLVFYWYRHDLERLQTHLARFKPQQLKTNADIDNWNAGKIQVLLGHPASAGHGLNLQAGGCQIEWFGNTWSLELYLQAIARLHRQGQQKVVTNNRLVARGTIDEMIIKATDSKQTEQDALLSAVKAIIKKYKG